MFAIKIQVTLLALLLHGLVIVIASQSKTSAGSESESESGANPVPVLPPVLKPKSNILFMTGILSHSHRAAVEPLAHELSARGHNISFLTPVPAVKANPKFYEISTKGYDKYYKEIMSIIGDGYFIPRMKDKYNNDIISTSFFRGLVESGADFLFNSDELKPWTESSTYDLIILDPAANRYGHALAYKFNASVIHFTTAGFWHHDEEIFGLPSERSWLPNYYLTNVFTEELTFSDKVFSVLYNFKNKIVMDWLSIPKVDEMARRALDVPEMPSILELEKETSLFFTNQHFSSDYPRSLPPFVVQVSGLLCTESSGSLPQELEKFIAGAGEHGFVYISFGTLINMSKVPEFLRKIFFDTFKSFKTRFLIKWDVEPPKDLPENVLAAKWFPQQNLLSHKMIKGFVSHCGHMSTQEAVCHGVPFIGIPVMGDQPYNAKLASYHRYGIHLELAELTTQVFTEAISSIINNPAYAENAKRTSELFKDRPMSALDTAVYWTEYALRHKNTSHMKPLSMHQSWWERRLLDVWLFLLCCAVGSVLIFGIVMKHVFQCFCRKGSRSESKKLKVK